VGYWRTPALCLRVLDWRETSYIVTWFTRERGKVAAVAKGAKRRGSKLRGEIEPLTRADLVLYQRKGSTGLHTLSELEVLDTYRGARRDRRRLHAALYVMEMLRELLAEEDPHPRLYDTACRALDRIANNRVYSPLTVIIFELLALAELGFAPRLDACVDCGAAAAPDAALDYAADMGGVVCRGCGRGARARVDLAAGVRAALLALGQAPERASGLQLAPAEVAGMRRVLDATIAATLRRPLRLARHVSQAPELC
jgi:DNA repair protein RecO (recombination protein O)